MYALVGVVAARRASRGSTLERLRALAPTLVVTALVLCLGVLAVGTRINGARRWIDVGPLVFQPSELAKLALVVWTAAYLSRRPPPRTLKELARPLGAPRPRLRGARARRARPRHGAHDPARRRRDPARLGHADARCSPRPTGSSSRSPRSPRWSSPYRRDRLLTFLDPWKDPTGAGLQNVQALISLGSGGIFGRGLGSGHRAALLPARGAHRHDVRGRRRAARPRRHHARARRPSARSRYAGIRLAIACRDPFAKRLAAGITALVCGQAAINMAAVVGVAPLTGIPLPFVSYGGSSLVVMLVGVGVLLNIARDGGRAAAAVPDRGRGDGRTRRAGARRRGGAAAARACW